MNSGFVIIDKPSGISSRAAGGRVRRMFGAKTFGHIGTLDPMASGVLVIALGEATKMIPYLERAPHIKTYEFSIQFGIRTDTDDITGKVIETDTKMARTIASISPTDMSDICASFVGGYNQTPPAYSAIHIDGVRAYELARRGADARVPARHVDIYELTYLGEDNFRVRCGVGTYVRSLAVDIAAKCHTIGTCTRIRRTESNGVTTNDAVSLDFLEKVYNNAKTDVAKYLRPIDFQLDDILVANLNDDDAHLFANGGFVANNGMGLRRVYNENRFIGIGEIIDNMLRPRRIIKD